MPIEVNCPDPQCARIHLVKSKYAGSRGKCPACGAWMYVPKTGSVPSGSMLRPDMLGGHDASVSLAGPVEPLRKSSVPLAAPVKPKAAPPTQPVVEEVVEEVFDLPPEAALQDEEPPQPKKRGRRSLDEELAPDADVYGVEETGEESEKPPKKFPVFAMVLILLGVLGLGAVSASPYLPKPTLGGTGGTTLGKLEGVPEEYALYVTLAPGLPILLAIMGLLAAVLSRGFGFMSLALVYLASLLAGALLFLGLYQLQNELINAEKIVQADKRKRETDKTYTGTVEPAHGMQLPAAVGGAGAATLLFLLAAVVGHRRWWGRLLCFFLLATPPALAGAWAFRKELGIEI